MLAYPGRYTRPPISYITSFERLGAFPSAGVRPIAHTALLDRLYGLLAQR